MSFPENVDKDSMMKQAQNIWTMLDEMADNNPQVFPKKHDIKDVLSLKLI